MMAGIKGKNTAPELAVRRHLHRSGLRFRLHDRDLPGTPDLVLRRYRTVVQVHGCFWHRHSGCRFAYMPSSNQSFWRKKFDGNVYRDRASNRALRKLGWRVVTVWECEVNDEAKLVKMAALIRQGQ
jgi:DNA mismatch endonuclease (patch repair protein)